MEAMLRKLAALTIMVSVILLSLQGLSQAQQRKEAAFGGAVVAMMAPPSPEEASSLAKQLKLPPEQQKQMQGVTERYRGDAQALQDEYASAVRNLLALIREPAPAPATANQRLKEFNNVHQAVLSREVQYWAEVKAILTPEQNLQLWNIFEQSRLGIGQGDPGKRQ
jgi:Spy/CpxP family protein refolding chaperone